VAQTISHALNLNLDLTGAIAIGHDLGHAPFGHRGEKCLAKIAKRFRLTYEHEKQTLRIVDLLESPYGGHPGLNLTFAVRDGIVMHCGERDYKTERLVPARRRRVTGQTKSGRSAFPATLEGCVVRWADKVAYLGRDLDDAVTAGIVTRADLPKEVRNTLGVENRQIIAKVVVDIVRNSQNQDFIAVSEPVRNAMADLYDFSNRAIYESKAVTRYFGHVEDAMRSMFEKLRERLRRGIERPAALTEDALLVERVLAEFVHQDLRQAGSLRPEQALLDFIAGMTDSFFISCHSELFVPKSTV